MARRRFGSSRRRSGGSRTRSLEWDALETGAMSGNIAANGNVNTVLQFNTSTSPEVKVTIYRVVGTISFRTNADVEAVFQMGLYRAVNSVDLDPGLQAEQENWMWWYAETVSTAAFQSNRIRNVHFDVKVKRILNTGDELEFVIKGSQIYNFALNARTLSKLTGT